MSAITIVAILKAREGCEQQLREELMKVIAPSRAEAGCLEYVLHENAEHPEQYAFYETWRDKAALEEHVASTHYQAYRQAAEALLESREVYRLNKITI